MGSIEMAASRQGSQGNWKEPKWREVPGVLSGNRTVFSLLKIGGEEKKVLWQKG